MVQQQPNNKFIPQKQTTNNNESNCEQTKAAQESVPTPSGSNMFAIIFVLCSYLFVSMLNTSVFVCMMQKMFVDQLFQKD